MKIVHPLFVAAFLASGAAGLFYELLWSRYLALFVGHTAYAQVLVLAVFLGGLAIGSLGIGDRSRRISRPLRWYIGAELVLAVSGLLYHSVYRVVTEWALDSVVPALAGSPALPVVRWGIAVLLILPQAIVLGATFPLMAAAVVRRAGRGGRVVSVLYAANSFGGAVGILLAGFLALRWLGLPGSLAAAAGLNVLAAALAWAGGRVSSEPETEESAGGVPSGEAVADIGNRLDTASVQETGRLWSGMLLVAGGTAFASFLYEIGWIRMLSLVMGSATHAFELMVSAFIMGLALGALLVRRAAQESSWPLALLAGVQWFMGIAALVTVPVYALSFPVTGAVVDALPQAPGAYGLFNLSRYGLALAVMLPSTVLAGMTLPLMTAVLLRRGVGERSIGWVYGINAMGSVLGVIVGGLIVLPLLGLKGILALGAAIDMGLGVWVWRERGRMGETTPLPSRRRWSWGAAIVAVLLAGLTPLDRAVLTGGVFRYGSSGLSEQTDVLFYRDGRTATVSVAVKPAQEIVVLSTNGKPDASLSFRSLRAARGEDTGAPQPILQEDEATQTLAGLYALAHQPTPGRVAVIGQGSGMTGQALLASEAVGSLITIEIEPEMIEGSQVYYPANRRVFDDPRSSFRIADAKTFFAEQDAPFDLIVSEPSNPWVSGVAGLFTTEFYERAARYLAPGGLFVQWIHLYEMEDRLVETILAAMHENFEAYEGYQISNADLLVVGSRAGPVPNPDWSVFQLEGVRADLAHVVAFPRGALESTWLFDRELLAPLLEESVPNSDYAPVLELDAERARILGLFAEGTFGLGASRARLGWLFSGRGVPVAEGSGVPPVPRLTPMAAWARSSWLSTVAGSEVNRGDAPDPDYADRLARQRLFRLQLEGDLPPDNWRSWMGRFEAVDRELHAGVPGQIDLSLFDLARDYMERQGAPAAARLAVQILEGIQRGDAERVAVAADTLIVAGAQGAWWIDPEVLMDATTMAYLEVDRAGDAARVLELIGPLSGRRPDDLRTRVLWAHVRAAGGDQR